MLRWFIIFFAISQVAFCQQLIEGKIIDAETGKPVPFASIGIVGTSKGTSSNLDGEFTLSVSGSVTIKVTCIGYESFEANSGNDMRVIRLKAIATQLNEIIIFNKAVNPGKIVRKAFSNIAKNYIDEPFLQKFFYRHYCKDDSAYGRLIEAFVDVWKHDGYRSQQKFAGDKEEIRVTQLRRSLDKTTMAQGHEPISIGNILQADVVGYQTAVKSDHLSFFTDVSNLKTDFESYTFEFKGVTTYDGKEVYEVGYTNRKDSALTASGQYMALTQATGSLFITTDTHTIVKTEEVRQFGLNTIRTLCYYRKFINRYYPYHLIREGVNHTSDGRIHSFHIDLMSVEVRNDVTEKFTGHEPGREQLLNVPYDSVFWNNNSILKTTPLEDKIIHDLGEGISLNKQFYLYRQYEMNVHDGGKNGDQKFNWFKEDSKGKRILYLVFWAGDCRPYFVEMELAKRLNKKYRNKISFVFLSLDDDEIQWQQMVSKYNLYSDGIINYRIGKNSAILKSFKIKEVPDFVLLSRTGELFDSGTRHPSDPQLEKDFNFLLQESN